jgi:uncharacterized membrane protein YeaQ/YmgE (transglycosylase-associated protein family)
MLILFWVIMGLIIGAIAKWIIPGKDPGGIMITTIPGMCIPLWAISK